MKPEILSIEVYVMDVGTSKFCRLIGQVMKPNEPSADPKYVYDSLTCLVDNRWKSQLRRRSHSECRNGGQKKRANPSTWSKDG